MSSSTEWSSISLIPVRCLGLLSTQSLRWKSLVYSVRLDLSWFICCPTRTAELQQLVRVSVRCQCVSLQVPGAWQLEREVLWMSWLTLLIFSLQCSLFLILQPEPLISWLMLRRISLCLALMHIFLSKPDLCSLCKEHWGGSTKYSHVLLLWQGAPCALLWPHVRKVCQP